MLRQIRRTTIKTIVTGTVVVGAIEVTTHLPSEGRSSRFYHKLCNEVGTPLTRRFVNPEDAHNLALTLLQHNLAPRFRPSAVESYSVDLSSTPFHRDGQNGTTKKSRLVFPSCVGLAAGFDKDGVAIKELMDLGFGFVEVGSVTPRPQPGNPRPRMFRLTEDLGIINRFGFNSVGADGVEMNLKAFRKGQIPSSRQGKSGGEDKSGSFDMSNLKDYIRKAVSSLFSKGHNAPHGTAALLGVNLGKNRDSTEETEDYEKGIRQLGPYADYIVVNISSPNTPGLRGLQKHDPIRRLLRAAVKERDLLPPQSRGIRGVIEGKDLPLLVKISPDLSEEDMEDIAAAVLDCGVDGIVVANTSDARPDNLLSKHRDEKGGLSGAPIRTRSTECIRLMYRLTGGDMPIIGVGGVRSGHDAYEKLRAGASLVQIYSMMVYEGPGLVSRIREELAELMLQNGQRRVEDVVGLDHDDIYWKKKEERMKRIQVREKVFMDE